MGLLSVCLCLPRFPAFRLPALFLAFYLAMETSPGVWMGRVEKAGLCWWVSLLPPHQHPISPPFLHQFLLLKLYPIASRFLSEIEVLSYLLYGCALQAWLILLCFPLPPQLCHFSVMSICTSYKYQFSCVVLFTCEMLLLVQWKNFIQLSLPLII